MANTYQHPGVYAEDTTMSTTPISGVPTAVTGFIGSTPRGERGKAIEVTSWEDYKSKFAFGLDSPFIEESYLTYAMYGFFLNGGGRAYVVSVTDGADTASSYSIQDSGVTTTALTLTAVDTGTWGDNIEVLIEENADNAGNYDVTVYYNGDKKSFYENTSMTSSDDNFIENEINDIDKFIEVTVESDGSDLDSNDLGVKLALTGGTDGLSGLTDTDYTDALSKFDNVGDISLLAIPDSQSITVTSEATAYCDNRGDVYFIGDGEETADTSAIKTFRSNFNSENASLYYPWIEVNDPIAPANQTSRYVPTCGHVAGVIARTDDERSVYKAPAGTDADLKGVISTKVEINDSMQDSLNPNGINVIRSVKNAGIVIWGARTLDSDDKYINISRGLIYLKNSIKKGTKWVVFEPNNPDLWRSIERGLDEFLETEYDKGGFKGKKPEEAFFTKCDSQLNTDEYQEQGIVRFRAGVAIAEPGEFAVLEIGQWDGGTEVKVL